VDSRLLLDATVLAISSGPPRGGQPFRVSTFGRHVIDDENADHDTDQQRRQKKIFHFIEPLRAAMMNSSCGEKVRRTGVRLYVYAKAVNVSWSGPHKSGLRRNDHRPKWKRPGVGPAFCQLGFEPSRTVSNYSVVVVTVDVPTVWPASAGRFAQAEKPNAAAQATMRTIRI